MPEAGLLEHLMSERESFSARQEKYAAWRDRLRNNEVIDLDAEAEPVEDPWSPDILFRTPPDPVDEDADADADV